MGVLLWLSDLHLDPFYGTPLAASHKTGGNCSLADNRTLVDHPLGRVGCDAPPSLLESALRNAASTRHAAGNIDWVLITGDFSRHAMDALRLQDPTVALLDPLEIAQSILATCVATIQETLPGVPILPVLGNNDVVPDYYLEEASADDSSDESADENESRNADEQDHWQQQPPSRDASLPDPKHMLESVTKGLSEAFATPQEADTFAHGGYFARLLPLSSSSSNHRNHQPSILLLSLNTILYSSRHQPDYFDHDDPHRLLEDPYGQFAWMESQLRQAAASASTTNSNATTATDPTIVGIYLAGHIPPTIGSYRHTQLWKDQYLETFAGILQDYSSGQYNPLGSSQPPPPLLGHFYGHVHTEEFRWLTYETKTKTESESASNSNATALPPLVVPLLVTSSITPIYGSNPSYRLVEYNDTTGALLDYKTHYLDLDRSDRIHNSHRSADTTTPSNTTAAGAATQSNATTLAAASHEEVPSPWIELPGFVQAYGVPDLSSKSFQSLVANLQGEFQHALCVKDETASGLWDTFLGRQNLYSSAPDDGDDTDNPDTTVVMMDWLCTIQASTSEDYESCLAARRPLLASPPASCGLGHGALDETKSHGDGSNFASVGGNGRMVLGASIGSLAGVLLVAAVSMVVWRKRCSKRRMYAQPTDHHQDADHPVPQEDSADEPDGILVINQRHEAIPNPDGEMA